MPYKELSMTPLQAIHYVCDILLKLEEDVARVTDRGSVRLDGMQYTKTLRKTKGVLAVARDLAHQATKCGNVTSLDDFEVYTVYYTRRKRGMLRTEHMWNVIYVLNHLKSVYTSPTFKDAINLVLVTLDDAEFPPYFSNRKPRGSKNKSVESG